MTVLDERIWVMIAAIAATAATKAAMAETIPQSII